jgi:hypothetical protein
MANSSTYLVQTRNRCVVAVYGDTAGGISFGITASAFNNGFTGTNVDPRIGNTSASLSRIVYGISGSAGVLLRFGATGGTAFMLAGNNSGTIDLERMTIHNNAQSPADGTFRVEVPAATTITAYLEFVPF